MEEQALFAHLKERFGIVFSAQQYEAVVSGGKPILLLAVPGAGKTTVLVTHTAHLIACRGVDPTQILTLTFNREAARDMEARFTRLFGERMPAPRFQTIHSFCYQVVMNKSRRDGVRPPKLVETVLGGKVNRLFSELFRKYNNLSPSQEEIEEAKQAIGYAKNMMLEPEKIKELDVCDHFMEIFNGYESYKRETGLIDFDDMLTLAYEYLCCDPKLLASVQDCYRYVQVDEAQDTSKIQHAIISVLAMKSRQLFMVGDEDQSIYGFRGAFPEALLRFQKDYPDGRILKMERNFRSTDAIIRDASTLISHNKDRYDKQMHGVRGEGRAVEHHLVTSVGEQYRFVLQEMRALPPGRTLAVLYRNNDSAIPLIDLMEREGVGFRLWSGAINPMDNAVTADVMAFLSLSADPSDLAAFARVFFKTSCFISKEVYAFVKGNHRPGVSVFSLMQDAPYKGRWDDLRQLSERIERLKLLRPADMIDSVLWDIGYERYLSRTTRSGSRYEAMLYKMDMLRELAKGYRDVYAFAGCIESFGALCKEKNKVQSPVTLSTVHASKGLEYDEVLLIDLLEGRFPSDVAIQSHVEGERGAIEEETRLFYVAMTRAKDRLVLVVSDEISRKNSKVSRFVQMTKTPPERPLPKTAPRPQSTQPPPQLAGGERVRHPLFGEGVVQAVTRERITVSFDGRVRELDADMCVKMRLLTLIT
ncbi:ATP-dependent helicase [Zongyangia hominis]|uniref:DNA 3'-5' helicase n=1 Tax=Zongyangia hominis TaxID=2763677 RepID=A0A926IB49_9FIRM|nr:ATP-dependent helicase [Zongyangia hominis]MBC8569913.1 ATP-dependent helicase [Zongyangia hominis]